MGERQSTRAFIIKTTTLFIHKIKYVNVLQCKTHNVRYAMWYFYKICLFYWCEAGILLEREREYSVIITFVRRLHKNGGKNRVHREIWYRHCDVYLLKTEETTTTTLLMINDNNANRIAAVNVAITITLLLFYNIIY